MKTTRVAGVGMTEFGKFPDGSLADLADRATEAAMTDADVDTVDAIYVGNVYGDSGTGPRVLSRTGLSGMPIVTIEAACASSAVAFAEASWAVASGRYSTVLVLGCEQLSTRFAGGLRPNRDDPEGRSGLVMPAMYAMAASRYMDEFGVTPEQLAAVSVKNHDNGAGNPRAQYRKRITLEDVLDSRMISDPLTLLQCSPISDGAAAVVISSEDRHSSGIRVAGSRLASGRRWDYASPYVWGYEIVRRVSTALYDDLHLSPRDFDFFEVHDAFTIGEIVTTEALGLADLGQGGVLVESGATRRDGASPVNPSGGLLSKGHPLGATGVSMIGEAVLQMRGIAGDCQIEKADRAFVETMGGGVSGIDGNACAAVVLERGA